MKIKVGSKTTEKSDKKERSLSSLSIEELRNPKKLSEIRKKHKKSETLDKYCEMLETQINSLVNKLLPLHEDHVKLNKKYIAVVRGLTEVVEVINEDIEKLQKNGK